MGGLWNASLENYGVFPLFVYSEADVRRLRRASLGKSGGFKVNFNGEAPLSKLRKASQNGMNGVRCFWIVPRRFCGTICFVFL